MTNDFSGGLRGLRPPATFLQPFGLRWETNNRGQETSSPFANDIFLGEEEETVENGSVAFHKPACHGAEARCE